ncbi:MAG: hypothetical protein KF708_19380 [Pirellulales bacterium]|nr:hypothetical protein [Pirellulales bacterium]
METSRANPTSRSSGIPAALFSLLVAACCHTYVLGAAPSEEETYLAGLRSRQLFRLAEDYCREQLARDDLAPRRRATLVVEQSRNLVQQALASPDASRHELWQQAASVVDDFARQHTDHPFVMLAEVQGAELRLIQGEALAESLAKSGQDDATRELPRRELRDAIERFGRLQMRIAEAQRRSGERRGPNAPDALTARELRSLERYVRFEQARAHVLQAQTYGRETPDWTNSLAQASELLAPLAQLATSEPLGWRSRLMQIECLRLAGNAGESRRRLALLRDLQPPGDVQLLAQAEELRLAISQRRLDELETLLAEVQPGAEISGQLDLALLEAYLLLWQDASRRRQEERAASWRQQAEEVLAQFEAKHGAFWKRRAESVLVNMIGASPQAADPAVLVRVADAFYSQGRPDDAITTYDRVREVAEKRGDANLAFEVAFKAAAVEHARDAHTPARERFRALALAYPKQPRAPEAHALAIFHAAQVLKLAGQDSDASAQALDVYRALIEEHLAHWPASPTASDAAWRLGRLHEHAHAWQAAIAAYRMVASGNTQYAEALHAIGRCYTLEIAELTERGEPSTAQATAAADFFSTAAQENASPRNAPFSPAQRVAALWAARFWIGHLQNHYDRAAALLNAAGAGGGVPLEWRSEAVPLLIVALAAQGQTAEARRLVGEVGASSASETLAMLEGLTRIAGSASADTAADIAAVEIDVVRQLRGRAQQLDATQSRRLDLLLAGALARGGRDEEAGTLYRALVKAHPDHGDVQEDFARWLGTLDDEESLRESLTRWNEIERRSRAGSDRWYRAKYAQAEALHRLGDDTLAVRLIKVTQTLYPSLGGPVLKTRFEKLLAQCQQP